MERSAKRLRKLVRAALWLPLAALLLIAAALWYLGIPQNAAAMAAKGVCSAAFVAGRPTAQLLAEEVLPASPVLQAISVNIDTQQRAVTATFAGLVSRRAVLARDRGCVLNLEPDPSAGIYVVRSDSTKLWPAGDGTVPVSQWDGVDAARLQAVVDEVFVGAGDPTAANARGLAVVHRGRLLISRNAPGFVAGTPLHGWSMTKTVTGMLVHKLEGETGLNLQAPVVSAFKSGREPAWVADWRKDARKDIKVMDLLYMRDGLKITEDYEPWGSVPHMLWGEPDAAAWAARHPLEADAGKRWRYLSATSNILSAVARGQFANDTDYWRYPRTALFAPIGATSATMETDTSGNWVGSSYLWASIQDWARLGQLALQDGKWGQGADAVQVLPPGWLARASTPATSEGPGLGYGFQTWSYGHPTEGDCKKNPGVPPDVVAMGGHWGQMVAVVPSRQAVIVRMGWVHGSYDECKLLADVLATLPK